MIQGTCSSAGKSLVVTALCRIFQQDGYKVAPFKSQNMALNSYVTIEGFEMGRAQAVQAEAAGIIPHVSMNPVLIKPTSDMKSQIIVEGKVLRSMEVMDYYAYKKKLKKIIQKNYQKVSDQYELVVIEGAGSPAEINLKKNDLVNMGMAKIANANVLIVGDIDKGGVFASLVGTIKLLSREERKRVKGVIINKFRGDIALLQPGLAMLEKIIKIPVVGVIPFLDIDIEDEDSVTERLVYKKKTKSTEIIDIVIIKFPYMSNYTDFNPFNQYEDVTIRYVESVDQFGQPDIIILPGTKNTIHDLQYIKKTGIFDKIIQSSDEGTIIFGICGGYQMMGASVADPYGIEGDVRFETGLSFFAMETTMQREKITAQVTGIVRGMSNELSRLNGIELKGYEIHMGTSVYTGNQGFIDSNGELTGSFNENIIGTYMHGVFDTALFTRTILNCIRKKKGYTMRENEISYREYKEDQYNTLAEKVRSALDIDLIYRIIHADN
ncbi:MAG TPA: cobyric acid synthase CobQ [Spirochaetia bacterium]|nr:cobyric acid synthase CobQ [Spirochaetia bacterium]